MPTLFDYLRRGLEIILTSFNYFNNALPVSGFIQNS